MEDVDENQNFTNRKIEISKDFSSVLSQHEDLRRATLLKHRKVSTQLKLDMVQRQLTTLRSNANSANDRQFYRQQITELSSELQDLGSTLDKVERNAFYAKKRLMRHCGMDLDPSSDHQFLAKRSSFYAKKKLVDMSPSYSSSTLPLSSSNPSLFTSEEDLRRTSSRCSLKDRVRHLMSSPGDKLRKRHFFGELRAAASLSSLNVKSGSPTSDENDQPTKEHKPWKAPLRFLGHLYDTRFRRKLWGGPVAIPNNNNGTKSEENILEHKWTSRSRSEEKDKRISRTKSEENLGKRTKSEENILKDKRVPRAKSRDNILEDKKPSRSKSEDRDKKSSSTKHRETIQKRTKSEENILEDKICKLEEKDNKDSGMDVFTSSSSSSSEEEEESDEYEEWVVEKKVVPRYVMKAPVVRKISQKAQVDPAVLAEIEDFEKMAAMYIKQHL